LLHHYHHYGSHPSRSVTASDGVARAARAEAAADPPLARKRGTLRPLLGQPQSFLALVCMSMQQPVLKFLYIVSQIQRRLAVLASSGW
jgi:hypothetical protein